MEYEPSQLRKVGNDWVDDKAEDPQMEVEPRKLTVQEQEREALRSRRKQERYEARQKQREERLSARNLHIQAADAAPVAAPSFASDPYSFRPSEEERPAGLSDSAASDDFFKSLTGLFDDGMEKETVATTSATQYSEREGGGGGTALNDFDLFDDGMEEETVATTPATQYSQGGRGEDMLKFLEEGGAIQSSEKNTVYDKKRGKQRFAVEPPPSSARPSLKTTMGDEELISREDDFMASLMGDIDDELDAVIPSGDVLEQKVEQIYESYEGMTVPQLKEILRDMGLKVGGRKSELIARLVDADSQ
uniref:SAP domain-containing protein n=1 Tax=Octactis speculum TaxID=3111310 RepID=A0A7S2F442_9STRA